MQIAIRDDQPRFDVSGPGRAGKPATGHPFDELVRAMSARESRTDTDRATSRRDIPERERPEPARDYAQRDAADRRHVDRAARQSSDDRRHDEPVTPPTAQATETPHPAETQVEPVAEPATPNAAGPVADPAQATTGPAAPDQTAPDQAAPDQATLGQTASDRATPGQAGAADPIPGAAQPGALSLADGAATPANDDILANLLAVMQSRGAAAGTEPGPAGPPAPGLAVALFAHSLAGTQQAPGPQTAMPPGQRIMAGNAPAKALGKQSQPSLGKEQGAAADFSAIAAALANNPAGGRGAAATAAAAGSLPAVSEGASAPPAPTGSGTPGAAALGERTAQPARVDGPAQPQHMPRLNGPQFAERIGLTIAHAAETGVDRVSIRLNPRELGRIDVRMELGQDGRMTMTVAADRQETLDQLQRNVRDLERALADAGFDTSAGDLSFSLRQQSPGDQDDAKRSGRDAESESEPEGGEAVDGMIITHQSDSHLVVDLFV